MKYSIFLFSFIVVQTQVIGQKYDQQWPFGWGITREQSFGVSMLDFNADKVEMYYQMPANRPSRLGANGSFVCDKEGQFILGTDNCRIFDNRMFTIEGGEDMNPGPTNDGHCDNSDYPSFYSSLILPEVTNDSIYYVIHKDAEIDIVFQDVHTKNLYLTVVVRRTNSSFYVREKNLLLKKNLLQGRLTAILSEKDNKWWVNLTGHNSNQYFRFKIGGLEKFEGPFTQNIGPVQNADEAWFFQSAFSPNGTMYAVNNTAHGVMLFDFDIKTGEFSNYRNVQFPNMDNHQGICFSPNSKYVYVTTAENLYQIDIGSKEVIHIAQHWEPGEDGWPVGIGFLHSGPDCRIYVSPSATNFYLHTILYPDRKGKDCEFALRAFRTPTNIDFGMPNLPMYRYNYGCDSTIQWPLSSSVEFENLEPQISIFPNPVSGHLNISSLAHFKTEKLLIYNALGQFYYSEILQKGQKTTQVDVSDWPSGVYFLVIEDRVEKFVVK